MQSKGFITVIAVALFVVCIFYLSFSFVTNNYENKAAAYAVARTGTTDVTNNDYKTSYNAYLDSIEQEKVFLGYTFQEAREMAVGLGLDLKGGMNVTLQISVPDILRALSNENPDPKFNQAIAQTDSLDTDFVAAFCREYRRIAPEGSLAQIFRSVNGVKVTDNNDQVETILRDEVKNMVRNSRNVLATRIDRFGVVSPNIQELESTGRIQLEMPGVKEPERMRKLLQGTANLEFYETYTLQDLQQTLAQFAQEIDAHNAADTTKTSVPVTQTLGWNTGRVGGPIIGFVHVNDTAAVNRMLHSATASRFLPTNLKAAWSVKPSGDNLHYELIALKTVQGKPVLDGSVVTRATTEYDNMQGNMVSMTMNDEGARKWARITQQNLNRSVAIVLDDQVYSYPNVRSVIDGGNSQITGNFTVEEAADLANVLMSGKMVAKVKIVSESVIGPSLGQEAIEAGMVSFVIALIILMVFLVAMYGIGPGMIANIGILLNLFFTMGILASFHAVLTLPGIAGIVLSLAMAVDANVLIYERTKEELAGGKNLKSAVAEGYKGAFSAIFDSNLTSIITGIILFAFGTGPIKGFATTLIIGLACSFFTAVYVTRVIIEFIMKRGGFRKVTYTTALSRKLLSFDTKFNFMGSRNRGFVIFGAIIVVFGILLAVRQLSPGIDFSGGRNYIVQFEQNVSTADIQAELEPLFPDASVSVITIDNDSKVRISTNYKIEDESESVDDEIMEILYKGLKPQIGDMAYEDFSVSNETIGIVSSEKVGPAIAADMTRDASWAVFFSLIAMALYILLRFRNIAFSIGALAAVAFTAYSVVGIYTLYGLFPFELEIDQNFIAAILTVIGYQVNDTVVVFDRVREYRALYPKQDPFETFNNSLNSTLSRTLVTGLSSLFVLIIIFFFGGETTRSFTFAMVIGIIIGTFASLFIAAPLAYVISGRSEKKALSKASK